jgi:hypothetical protein
VTRYGRPADWAQFSDEERTGLSRAEYQPYHELGGILAYPIRAGDGHALGVVVVDCPGFKAAT